ncbi:hypothetical protein [Variovorax sp. RCC_210]|uniref:hypothetical protein n=1 Tax=Variovorax sp. RCC_210 TaxID=3239217 RepID=UPI003524BF62
MTKRSPNIEVDSDEVFACIRMKPVRWPDLARTRTAAVLLRPVIDGLLASGAVKFVRLGGSRHLAAAAWSPSKEEQLAEIYGRCRAVDGCMLWTGRLDPQRGPAMYAAWAGTERSVRRRVWGIRSRRLDRATMVVMTCANPEDCVLFEHMQRANRGVKLKGKPKTLLHRNAIAAAKRKTTGKLTDERVALILASEKSTRCLAREMDVSQATVQAVRSGDRWRNYRATPFTGLDAANDAERRRA